MTLAPAVRKAIFPAAGLGTRFLPVTKAQPKEMLPLVDKPTIQYGVEEAIASGIEQVIMVTGGGKRAIVDHFDRSLELEHYLEQRGKSDLLRILAEVDDRSNRDRGPTFSAERDRALRRGRHQRGQGTNTRGHRYGRKTRAGNRTVRPRHPRPVHPHPGGLRRARPSRAGGRQGDPAHRRHQADSGPPPSGGVRVRGRLLRHGHRFRVSEGQSDACDEAGRPTGRVRPAAPGTARKPGSGRRSPRCGFARIDPRRIFGAHAAHSPRRGPQYVLRGSLTHAGCARCAARRRALIWTTWLAESLAEGYRASPIIVKRSMSRFPARVIYLWLFQDEEDSTTTKLFGMRPRRRTSRSKSRARSTSGASPSTSSRTARSWFKTSSRSVGRRSRGRRTSSDS